MNTAENKRQQKWRYNFESTQDDQGRFRVPLNVEAYYLQQLALPVAQVLAHPPEQIGERVYEYA